MFKWLWDNLCCWHEWKDTDRMGILTSDGHNIGQWYEQKCTKCGSRKIQKVST